MPNDLCKMSGKGTVGGGGAAKSNKGARTKMRDEEDDAAEEFQEAPTLGETGTTEQGDATATMGLQDALDLLPQELHRKIVPANRTFVLRRTSTRMRAAVENAKLDNVL